MKARPNVVLLVVAGLVLVLAVIAALVSASRGELDLDPATPDGTVQLYIKALYEGDEDAALALLDPELGCEEPFQQLYLSESARVGVLETEMDGDTATVVIEVEEESGAGLFESWSHRETFELIAAGDGWLITGEPWPVYYCGNEKVLVD